MSDARVRSQHYRSRAAECRALVERASVPEVAARYEEMAQRYDLLASQQEELAQKGTEDETRLNRDEETKPAVDAPREAGQ